MKDFGKKFISAAMALTLAASMSVYAEEALPVESVNGGVMAENAVNGVVGCTNHVTFRTDEYFVDSAFVGTHVFEGNTCSVSVEIYQYDLICMKCHETVKTIKRTVDVHSVSHP